MTVLLLLSSLVAGLVSLVLCRLVIAGGLRDAPTEQHKVPGKVSPSAGGVAVITAIFAAVGVVAGVWPGAVGPTEQLAWGLFAAGLAGLTGLYDDLWKPGALTRLVVHMALAGLVGALFPVLSIETGLGAIILPYALAAAGTALWIVVITNAANFIDGADGMLGLSIAPGLVGLIAAGLIVGEADIALWSVALLAALIGFLVWNMGLGRLIVGDTGAIFIGYSLGAIGVDLADSAPAAVWLAPLFFLPVLADVLLTLLYRAARGANLAQGHREHLYQLALAAGMTHRQVAATYAFLAVPGVVLGLSALWLGPGFAVFALVALSLIFASMALRARRSARMAGRLA